MLRHLRSAARMRLRHEALLYRNPTEYIDGVGGFVEEGLVAGERVLVAVPAENAEELRPHLSDEDAVVFADMRQLGRNPSRIIPAIRSFLEADPDIPARFVGEPIWHGRDPEEIAEATIHESLINRAFGSYGAAILCPYDVARLSPETLADSDRTHPMIVDGSGSRQSPAYCDPERVCDHDLWPLSAPPAGAALLPLAVTGLREVRRVLADQAELAGLGPERIADLLLAVSEVATNALVHGSGKAVLRAWVEPKALVCAVHDNGHFDDLLVGRNKPPTESVGKRGLWMVNQLCDLVELRSGTGGTTVRIRVDLPPVDQPPVDRPA